jgi:hypothetical protein
MTCHDDDVMITTLFQVGFEPSPSLPQLTFTIQPTPLVVI